MTSHYQERINSPDRSFNLAEIREIWDYRHLLFQLVLRQHKIRYKQSALGLVWAVVNPLITMIVFTLVFDRMANVPSYDIPYPVFSFAGLVPWNFFSKNVAAGTVSVVTNSALIRDVYVPRYIIPVMTQFSGLVDLAISFVVFIVLMLGFGLIPSTRIIFLPFFLLLIMMVSLGISFFLAALHVRFRDVGHLIGYTLQLLLLLSPVAYPSDIMMEPWRTLYGLNPMVTAIDGWRWAILGLDILHLPSVMLSFATATLLLVGGYIFYSRAESTFADWI